MKIIEAVQSGNIANLEKLLSGRNKEELKNALQEKDSLVLTPLHYAVKYYDLDMAKLLLEAGAYVDVRNSSYETPLHVASGNAHPDMVQLLINNRANVNAKNDRGFSPIHYALYKVKLNNSTQAVCVTLLLVRNKANYLQRTFEGDIRPFYHLKDLENADVIKALIIEEAEKVNPKKDVFNIIAAAQEGFIDIVREHVSDVVDVNMTTLEDRCPALVFAVKRNDLEIAKVLIDA